MSGPLDLDAIAATDALLRELHAPTKAIAQSPESTRPNWPERKCFYCEADWPCEPIRAAVHLTALVGRVRELESEIEHERRVHDDDLNAFIREEAKRDPAFATAYLNAEARTERDAATAEVLRLERVLAGTVLLKDDFVAQRDVARTEAARLAEALSGIAYNRTMSVNGLRGLASAALALETPQP